MLFYLPLAISVIATGFFLFFTDEDWKWKVLALVLVGLSLGLQLIPDLVHWLVPMLIQAGVSIWMVIYWKMDH